MKQNVDNNILDYQDLLILAYFKANYKKYKFNEIAQIMGMLHVEMRSSIERLLDLKYHVYINDNVIISKRGEKILEEKRLGHFFCNNKKEEKEKRQMSIDEIYIPIKFEM